MFLASDPLWCPSVLTFGSHLSGDLSLFVKCVFRSIRTTPYATHVLKASVCEPLELKSGSAHTFGAGGDYKAFLLPLAARFISMATLLRHTAGITPPSVVHSSRFPQTRLFESRTADSATRRPDEKFAQQKCTERHQRR